MADLRQLEEFSARILFCEAIEKGQAFHMKAVQHNGILFPHYIAHPVQGRQFPNIDVVELGLRVVQAQRC